MAQKKLKGYLRIYTDAQDTGINLKEMWRNQVEEALAKAKQVVKDLTNELAQYSS